MSRRQVLASATHAALVGSVGIFAVIGIGPWFLGYRTLTVLSGSMRPTFAPGDLILVRAVPLADLRVGDAITYAIPVGDHHIETHRIVKIVTPGVSPTVITKGDANTTVDPWQATLHGGTGWRYVQRAHGLGYAIIALRSPLAHMLTVFALPVLLAMVALARIWGLSFLRIRGLRHAAAQ